MRVAVYFNLHRKLWSVKALEGDRKGRVIDHATSLTLSACTFKVSEAGRQRVLREGRKNVHAFVIGELEALCPLYKGNKPGVAVSYNPRKYRHFYNIAASEIEGYSVPVHAADHVVLDGRSVTAFGVR